MSHSPAPADSHQGALYALVLAAYARQFTTLDANDATAFASCFNEDGTLYISGRGWFRSRPEIADFVRNTRDNRPRHFYSQVLPLELSDDVCRAQATFLAFDDRSGTISVHGITRDRLRYVPRTGWLFDQARVLVLWTSEHYRSRGRTAIETDLAAHFVATG